MGTFSDGLMKRVLTYFGRVVAQKCKFRKTFGRALHLSLTLALDSPNKCNAFLVQIQH